MQYNVRNGEAIFLDKKNNQPEVSTDSGNILPITSGGNDTGSSRKGTTAYDGTMEKRCSNHGNIIRKNLICKDVNILAGLEELS